MPDQTPRRVRRRIGRYVVTGRIGRGGMGQVYRAYDEALEREVAVKTLTSEGLFDDESRARFGIEARAIAQLQHPNILTVFELGEDRGVPFIVMELLPGVDLEQMLRSGEELLLREKLDLVAQVCRGLAYAHERGIVHRDMKPSNVRVLDDGSAKIMDFGIAKVGGTNVTKSGMMVGTVHYMSPEQIRGAALDGRSDVFSAGVILYELLGGRRPFSGSDATQVLYRIVHEPPPALAADLGPAGGALRACVERALAKEPDQRYASATALADELSEIVAQWQPGAPPQEELADLNDARRLLREGRLEEGLGRLRTLVQKHPTALEPRRALRTAQRELLRRERTPSPAPEDDYPELEATFQAAPTLRGAETDAQAQSVPESSATPRPAAPRLLVPLLVGGAALFLIAVGGALLLFRPPPPQAPARLVVRSQPPGASVWLDGRETGTVTDGELALPAEGRRVRVTFRKAGYADVTRELSLPLPGSAPLSVALVPLAAPAASLSVVSDPPGARVTLDGREQGLTPLSVGYDPQAGHRVTLSHDGYRTHEATLAPGQAPKELRVALEPVGPEGVVLVSAAYPLDVAWRGRVLARGQMSPRVSLPEGRQTLTLTSARHFLRTNVVANVRAGAETSVQAPALGRLNIRATPDNCEVLINGSFADYPPILDRPVVAGTLTVTFKWSDGQRRDETVEVPPGGVAYVTGRKD